MKTSTIAVVTGILLVTAIVGWVWTSADSTHGRHGDSSAPAVPASGVSQSSRALDAQAVFQGSVASSQAGENGVRRVSGKLAAETELVLRGTLATGNPLLDSALISVGFNTGAARYGPGDLLPGGAVLVAVLERSVEIRTPAGMRVLKLDETPADELAPATANAGAGNASLEAALREARGDSQVANASTGVAVPAGKTSLSVPKHVDAREMSLDD